MAIEFNCPYCTATIRVADEFSGKRGSCPKCDTRLLVPDIVPRMAPGPATESAAPTAPAPLHAAGRSVADDVPVFVPPTGTSSVSRSLRKKRRRSRSQRMFAVIVPVICFLAFLGLLATVFLTQQADLTGTLRGNVAADMEIPRVTVSMGELGLSEDDEMAATAAFASSPETFVSAQMICTIGVEGRLLTIDVRHGDGFSWFALNPGSNPHLAAWIRKYTVDLNTYRLKYASEAGADLCRDKILKASGTPVVFNAERYRDGFALNSHVGAFGFAVEAVTTHHRTPCAHQDSNGTLYFSLPHDTTKLTLRGRSLSGGQPLFPGEYQVILASDSGAVDLAPSGSAETTNSDDGMTPDLPEAMDGTKPLSEDMSETTDPSAPKMMPNNL